MTVNVGLMVISLITYLKRFKKKKFLTFIRTWGNVFCLAFKVFYSFFSFLPCFWSKKCAGHFYRESTNDNKQLKKQKQKHGYITHTWSGQAIKGTVVNAYDTPSMEGHLKFQEQYK